MPNRIIKESITTSVTLASLSDAEERHFWRLIVQADDFGYLDARPEVIRARAYPMMLKEVDEQESERRTLALVSGGLLHLFEDNRKRYAHFPTWDDHQQKRAKYSKYPQVQSCDINCNHVLASAPETLDIRNETLETRHITETEAQVRKPAVFALPEWIDKETWDAFLEMRKKKRVSPTPHALKLIVGELEKFRLAGDDPKAVLEKSIMSNWTGVFPLKERSANGTSKRNPETPGPDGGDPLQARPARSTRYAAYRGVEGPPPGYAVPTGG